MSDTMSAFTALHAKSLRRQVEDQPALSGIPALTERLDHGDVMGALAQLRELREQRYTSFRGEGHKTAVALAADRVLGF